MDILGAIVFGSRAKEMALPSSDLDILIIADGINPKRHRRENEIITIKRSLPAIPLDILLMTSGEVISNFKNHNPLFFDIAEDGIILLDSGDFLMKLVLETKDYIKAKGIKKWKDGWKFPVRHRVATYLSGVSNKDFAMDMIKDGERDYIIGKKLLEEGFYDKSVYHCLQSIEKCLKSILIAFGVFQKTHFVGEILINILNEKDMPELWIKKLTEIAEIAEQIEPEVSLTRYPVIINDNLWLPWEEYDKEDAERGIKKAENVLSTAKDFLAYWFLVD